MHVVLNMAASFDGRVAGPEGEPVQLSCPADHRRVHRLRAASDAVLVGVETVLADDPRLTARTDPPPAEAPLRVVLDHEGRTPSTAHVVDGQAPALVVTGGPTEPIGQAEVQAVEAPIEPAAVVALLEARGVEQLMVEGGPTVAASFLSDGLVDRLCLYIAPRILGAGPSLPEALTGRRIQLRPRARGPLGEGTLVTYGVDG